MSERRHPMEEALGYRFADPALLTQALTHRGSLGGHGKNPGDAEGNERLEFLGDRVLGLIVADALLKTFPDENEGSLAQRLAALVSAPAIAQVASAFGLSQHLTVAKGQRVDDSAVLADACEAVIGALFLDGGLEVARAFVGPRWEPLMHADLAPPKDSKTALQEWAQGRGLPLPAYRLIDSSGPAHAPAFTVSVTVMGHPEKQGKGRTKRLAEQAAAAALLENLETAS